LLQLQFMTFWGSSGCVVTVPVQTAASSDLHALLDVPILNFELDWDVPVLIDEHYNARALEDLILVVENAANQ
jgi:hypothetical protein